MRVWIWIFHGRIPTITSIICTSLAYEANSLAHSETSAWVCRFARVPFLDARVPFLERRKLRNSRFGVQEGSFHFSFSTWIPSCPYFPATFANFGLVAKGGKSGYLGVQAAIAPIASQPQRWCSEKKSSQVLESQKYSPHFLVSPAAQAEIPPRAVFVGRDTVETVDANPNKANSRVFLLVSPSKQSIYVVLVRDLSRFGTSKVGDGFNRRHQ